MIAPVIARVYDMSNKSGLCLLKYPFGYFNWGYNFTEGKNACSIWIN
jgi:hypothetical protein